MDGLSEHMTFFEAVRNLKVKRVKEFDNGIPEDDSLDYINKTYNKSFKVGQQIKANGLDGWILRGKGAHVIVGFGDNNGHIYHPNDVI